MQIRKLEKEDILKVSEIEREAFGDRAWAESLFLAELYDKDKHYFVAYENDTLIGYGGFAHILSEAHIMNIAVASAHRKKGVGKEILSAILKEAKRLSITAVTLEVSETNGTAISFYKSFGFTSAGLRPNYYKKGEGALILWLEL
ncbi:MAG: ribosomal protein S18-alanine N-acetyltransferase [Firmicutes bacterium]|nr:ribosomal protein S18-alanine N-acetyltransferase [Bacillota bacterium]